MKPLGFPTLGVKGLLRFYAKFIAHWYTQLSRLLPS